MFTYLKRYYHPQIVLDPSTNNHNWGKFCQVQCSEIYLFSKEYMHCDVSSPRGVAVF